MAPSARKDVEARAAPGVIRSIAFRLGAVGVGILLALLLVELSFRVLGVRPPVIRSKTHLMTGGFTFHCYSSNPHGEFRPVPRVTAAGWKLFDSMMPPGALPLERLRETPWCVEYRYTRQRLRDRFYEQKPAAGRIRIAGMGDSFALGEGVPVEKSLFKQMETQHGSSVEIVNGAQVGISLRTEVGLLKELVAGLGCTRAIVVVIANDIELTQALATQQAYINDLINVRDQYLAEHESRAWYAGHLRIVEVVGSFLERSKIAKETVQWYRDAYDRRKNGTNLDGMRSDFEALARIPRCETVVVVYPLMEDLGDDYPLRAVHRTIVDLASGAGLPVLDLEPAFRGHDTEAMQVHPSDHHPNGRAHALAARTILRWLRAEQPGFLPAPSTD